jgi:hypothetical protein
MAKATAIADFNNNRIREVSPDGIITTITGDDEQGYAGDGGPPIRASLSAPTAKAVSGVGNVYVGDSGNNAIRICDRPIAVGEYDDWVRTVLDRPPLTFGECCDGPDAHHIRTIGRARSAAHPLLGILRQCVFVIERKYRSGREQSGDSASLAAGEASLFQ